MAAVEKSNVRPLMATVRQHTRDPKITSLELMKTPHAMRPIAIALLLLVAIVVLCLIFVPWQQSVTGYGRVMIFSPMDRPQSIEAQIPGRLVRWNLVEGQAVKAGDVIAELEDIDSKFLTDGQVERLKSQRGFTEAQLAQAASREAALEGQLKDLDGSRNLAIPAAEQRARQAEDTVRQAEQNVEQARQAVVTEELNLKRVQELFDKGLRSKRDLELQELAIVTARTRLETNQAGFDAARKALQVARLDRDRVVNDTSATLNSVRASLASVRETIAKTNSDLQKLEVDVDNVSLRAAQRLVRAPRDGKIVRVRKVGQGETVKAGDELAVLAPTTDDKAVEMWLSDYDAPLVSVGRTVRLNFAGWPAVQFVGWPSIAVGTFAGKVKVMDAVDDGKNRFRVLIVPDDDLIKSGKEEPWPPLDQLRPGAEVNGWVMLDTVSLGFELWRQFNAFPPSLSRPVDEKSKAATFKEKEAEGKGKGGGDKEEK
ncbi:MAG: biotin/lipoyl-binding protein [Blastocatellia bacterium]|nr:biotin/lipoyl-binding protein [Blastocatellia bacterium]